jgi:hypothetical protein
MGIKAVEILPKVVADAPVMTRMCDCESSIKCKMTRKLFTPNSTSRAIEPLQLLHSAICGPLETAITGGRYMLLFIDDATTLTDDYILKEKLEALHKFKEWKALRERSWASKTRDFVQIEAVCIPARNSQNTKTQKAS